MKKILSSINLKLNNWWKGKYIPPPANDPSSPIVIISSGRYEKPVLARFIIFLWRFWASHWKILLPVIVGATVPLYIYYYPSEHSFQNAGIQNRPNLKIAGHPLIKYIRGTSDTPITIKNINDRNLGLTLSLGTEIKLINKGNTIAKLMFEVVADKYSGIPEIRKFILDRSKIQNVRFNFITDFYKVIEINQNEEHDFMLTRTIENPINGMFTLHYLFIYSNEIGNVYDSYIWARYKMNPVSMLVAGKTDKEIKLNLNPDELVKSIELVDINDSTHMYSKDESKELISLLRRLQEKNKESEKAH